jgi:multidrug resistance efflux pump
VDIARPPKSKRSRYVMAAVGILVVGVVSVALGRLKPAAPAVERSTVWIDSVRLGTMLRSVRGSGTLVPERIRWVSAVTAGRVERVNVRPGATVTAGSVLLELSNPDVQLQALEAQRGLTAAQAELLNLRITLETSRLNQRAAVAAARAQHQSAVRDAAAAETLATRNMIPTNELSRTRENEQQLATRIEVEDARLTLITEAADSQLALQRAQVERMRAIAEFQQQRVRSMVVTAGAEGVVQDLDLQPGQWVVSGTTLARVVEPGRLKAVVRIPETQARDIALGQTASVDTRNGIVAGSVVRIDPAAQNGTVAVDIGLEGALPRGARPDLTVEGTIELERLDRVLFVGRPAYGQPEGQVSLFRLAPDGKTAERVSVQLGKSSVNTVEVTRGLSAGDRIIISDMSQYDNVDRVRLN